MPLNLLYSSTTRSPSSRRAWVEISQMIFLSVRSARSPSSRRAWVEIGKFQLQGLCRGVALLAEGVGRNIEAELNILQQKCVALLAEGVGRNISHLPSLRRSRVALLAEGVGRNWNFESYNPPISRVALLAEGVGRNHITRLIKFNRVWSPSSRRAWVEITGGWMTVCFLAVALLAEGVGRNCKLFVILRPNAGVALLAEGVGRNAERLTQALDLRGRPPRGGRG